MINAIETSPAFKGKAIVKVNITKPDEFKRNLAQVGRDLGKEIQFSKLSNNNAKIPGNVLFVSGTAKVARRGTNIGFIIEDSGDDTTLVNALKKVFGNDKVQSWEEFFTNKKQER